MVDALSAVLNESHDSVMRGVLESCNQGDGLFSNSVDKHILAFPSVFKPFLDHIIRHKHYNSKDEEREEGEEEVSNHHHIQHLVGRIDKSE